MYFAPFDHKGTIVVDKIDYFCRRYWQFLPPLQHGNRDPAGAGR